MGDKLKDISNMKCKDFYWEFINKIVITPAAERKWTEIFPKLEEANIWPRIYKMAFTVTRETYVQSLQYRLIHRILPTNKWLFNIKILDSPQCSFCDEVDTILHFMLY